MINTISTTREHDYLVIVASAKIVSNEEYQELVDRYATEIVHSQLQKVLIDETQVEYAPSLLLHSDIVSYYSREPASSDLVKTWQIACVGAPDADVFYEFWESIARNAGYNQKFFTTLEKARTYLQNS